MACASATATVPAAAEISTRASCVSEFINTARQGLLQERAREEISSSYTTFMYIYRRRTVYKRETFTFLLTEVHPFKDLKGCVPEGRDDTVFNHLSHPLLQA